MIKVKLAEEKGKAQVNKRRLHNLTNYDDYVRV